MLPARGAFAVSEMAGRPAGASLGHGAIERLNSPQSAHLMHLASGDVYSSVSSVPRATPKHSCSTRRIEDEEEEEAVDDDDDAGASGRCGVALWAEVDEAS